MMQHTCSYYCERPECIRAQRDELRDRLEKVDQGGATVINEQGGMSVIDLESVINSSAAALGGGK